MSFTVFPYPFEANSPFFVERALFFVTREGEFYLFQNRGGGLGFRDQFVR